MAPVQEKDLHQVVKRFLVIAALLSCTLAYAGGPADVTPRPAFFNLKKGVCKKPVVREHVDREDFAKLFYGSDFAFEEAYVIKVGKNGIDIQAGTPQGAFRARTTLRQMMEAGGDIPCCFIMDYPRFRHRGLMLDESRTFKGKEFILKQIDAMTLLKMNVLHLHLDDSAGWRLEVESAPKLCSQAAWRIGDGYFDWEKGGYRFSDGNDPAAYGGYYTKDDIREIVAYAAARYINVIPEIEMPGHSLEVNKAYPEISCRREDGSRSTWSWDLCPGNEGTFALLEGILDEVMELFPSQYIHIGGDEAVMKDWENCVNCRKRMEEEGMKEVKELQGYLVRRIDAYVRSKGRRIIGWDEILETGVPEDATVQSWRGVRGGIRAASMGHDVIMSPSTHCYLNYYQDLIRKEPRAFGTLTSLKHAYSFNPVPEGLTPDEEKHILGLQGNLWCELIDTPGHAEYMLYPRLFAIAETGWTIGAERDYDDFRRRAEALCGIFRHKGYNCFDLGTESERARSCVFHNTAPGDINIISHDYGKGPVLSFKGSSGQSLLTEGDLGFKDMNANGRLDPFEDWRLSPAARAADLEARIGAGEKIYGIIPGEDLEKDFASGTIDNPLNMQEQ